ncbi:murein hydrolase activator EnvC family protein [Oceanivirga salmonicida]|uniref:murein hydrolase activator EnvC family protein n=1 Tax=Oceanivirga salmonicida TaxID=1769291 RepID=UPI00082F2C6D|nr:peptidoglycan DD-metalloendopeptidase family protein [Oceanivirga salmonicida]
MKIKKIGLFILILGLTNYIFADNRIDKNKNRINQINRQVNANSSKIKKNKNQIYVAKKTEKQVKREINNLNYKIDRLQKEYRVLESKYIKILKDIGKNDSEIRDNIKKINDSNEKIEYNKTEYSNKIIALDKVRRSRVIEKDKSFERVRDAKKKQDEKKILALQVSKIQGIEYYKTHVEKNKQKVEVIKKKNLVEASNVKKARIQLENKRKELKIAKIEKDRKVAQLKKIQSNLGHENKKLQSKISKLIREKRNLEAQIQAIIAQNQKKKASSGGKEDPIVVIKGTGRLSMPINGRVVVRFRQEKVKGLKSNGIEIRGKLGQNVKAADTGTVLHAGKLGSLGGIVIIDHAGIITVYGNLASVRVKKRDNVKKGQSIGTLGRDSATKETNLYFETRKGVNLVDPLRYL